MQTKRSALQDLGAPDGVCFGCGAKNANGLRIKSYWDSDNLHVITKHTPDSRYVGWPSLLYGGLISCLIDCHSNWTVIANHYRNENREVGTMPRIECVTGSLGVTYLKPTPMGVELMLRARVEGEVKRATRVICEVYVGDELKVLGDSVFVRVDVDHLAKVAHS